MKTNNRTEANASITDDSKVGAIIMTMSMPGLDDIIDDNRRGGDGDDDGKGTGGQGNEGGSIIETAEAKAAREATEAANAASAKAREEANKAIATKYSGVSVNSNGDILDAQGKIVKTKAEVDAAEAAAKDTAEAVEIEGVKYKLNTTGDAVNADGTVFKTKAELDAMESGDELPLVTEVVQKIGIQPLDDKGQPIVYEDSVDGLMKLVDDIAVIKQKHSEKELFKTFPKVEKYLRHIASGGDDKTFFNVVKDDYLNVNIDEKNVEQQKQILHNLLIKRGFSPAQASKNVARSVDANEILVDSQEALKDLQKIQKDYDAQVERQNAERVRVETENRINHWKTVETAVNNGKIKGIVIPEADRKAFFQYISVAVDDDGNSQAAIDRSNEDIETTLLTDFYRYKKYSLDALVRDNANKEQVKKLRSRIDKAKGTQGSGLPKDEPTTSGKDITLDKLIS